MADDIVNDGRCQHDVRVEEEAAKTAKAAKAEDDKAKPTGKS